MYPTTAIWIPAENLGKEVLPANGKYFTLKELRAYVGGSIEVVRLWRGMSMVCNEEGKLLNLPINTGATIFVAIQMPLFPQLIAGDVLFTHPDLLESEDEPEAGDDFHDT